MNRLGSSVSRMVCVVPQQQAAWCPPTRREGFVWTDVNRLHRLRRDLGFVVSDRIRLWIAAPAETQEAIGEYHGWIANELLAREIVAGEAPAGQQVHELDLDGSPVRAALSKEL